MWFKELILESGRLFLEISPWLILGLLLAGVIHIFLPQEKITHHLSGRKFLSILKATIVGIPLPLCSCSVIPVTTSLKKEGAGDGACVSFLISTPTSGVDSFLVTYSLLGGVFAFFRVIGAFIIGVIAGMIVNLISKKKHTTLPNENSTKTCKICKPCCNTHPTPHPHTHTTVEKLRGVFQYGFRDMLGDISTSLIIGILIGGAITYFFPTGIIEKYIGKGFLSMVVILLVAIPLYVCATGSIPIAGVLMLKGLSPGAALVFLFAGPATNAVTVSVIGRYFGKKILLVYLGAVIIGSMVLGGILNHLLSVEVAYQKFYSPKSIPLMIKIISATLLGGCLLYNLIKKFYNGRK
jgi:hypothetical protein